MSNYTFRKSVLEKPQHWELTGQELVCTQEGGANFRIPYTRVQKIRLLYLPNNRYRLNNYCCKITMTNNRTFDINSCTYESFATFPDQAETYIPFVKELVKNVKAANPDCKILTGQTPFAYYGNIVFVVVAVSFLFLIFSWLPVDYGKFYIIIKLIVIVYMGAYLAKSIKVNKPRQLSVNEIPDYVLPKTGNKNEQSLS
ncbi:MAG: hypothetical protein KDC15_03330 [Chitinophagaceae bacterium]|nr:hypothetical protein [Chitinophagaceae bacterium]